MRHMLFTLMFAVSALAMTGCGGTGSTILGENSDVVAMIQGESVPLVEMTISPNSGAVNDPDACTVEQSGFGCMGAENATTKQISFTTTSDASDNPYLLYLESSALLPVEVRLRIQLDGGTQIDEMVEVPAGGATVYVRIFRNNAELVQGE